MKLNALLKKITFTEGARLEFETAMGEAVELAQFVDEAFESNVAVKVYNGRESAEFLATFGTPAMKISGDVVKFKLEVPESEIAELVKVVAYMRGVELELELDVAM